MASTRGALWLVAGTLLWVAPRAQAGEDEYWDPAVITPTGQPQRVSDAPSTVHVITAEEIRDSGATSIVEVLRRVPGLDVRQIGAGYGQVGPRGFAYELAKRVLVLIDGRSAHADFFGSTVYETLPVSLVDIDRIEVVLGPGAAVYGNKALLGVINIVTRSAVDYPRFEGRLGLGGPADARAAFRYGRIDGNWSVRTSGFLDWVRSFHDSEYLATQAAGGSFHAEYRPSLASSFSLETGGVNGLYNVMASGSRIDPFQSAEGYLQGTGHFKLGGVGSPLGEVGVRAGWRSGHATSPVFPGFVGGFDARWHVPYFEATHAIRYAAGRVPMQTQVGLDVRASYLTSTITVNDEAPFNVGGYVSQEVELWKRVRVSAGLRADRTSWLDEIGVPQYQALSPRPSIIYSPVEGHHVRVAYNEGYNNPNHIELFSDFDAGGGLRLLGNPDLEAERISYPIPASWRAPCAFSSTRMRIAFAAERRRTFRRC